MPGHWRILSQFFAGGEVKDRPLVSDSSLSNDVGRYVNSQIFYVKRILFVKLWFQSIKIIMENSFAI